MTDKKETVSEAKAAESPRINLGSWLLVSLADSGDDSEREASFENLLMYNRWI